MGVIRRLLAFILMAGAAHAQTTIHSEGRVASASEVQKTVGETAAVGAQNDKGAAEVWGKVRDAIKTADYGVKADGTTDDTANATDFQNAVQARLTAGLPVHAELQHGVMLTSAGLHFTVPYGVRFSMSGSSSSIIKMIAAGSALSINATGAAVDSHAVVQLDNIQVAKAAGVAGGAEGVEIIGSNPFPRVQIHNTRCVALSAGAAGPWHSCMHLVNIIQSDIDGVMSNDQGSGLGDPQQGIGVWLEGSQGLYSADNHFTHLNIGNGFAAVAATGHIEGLQISQSTVVGSSYCVYAPGLSSSNAPTDSSYDWITVEQTHCNTYIRGLYVVGGGSVKASGDLFYSTSIGTSPPTLAQTAVLPLDTAALNPGYTYGGFSYVGIDTINSADTQVTGNEFQGFLAYASNFVRMENVSFGRVTGANSNHYTITDNIMSSTQGDAVYIGPTVGHGVISANYYSLIVGSGKKYVNDRSGRAVMSSSGSDAPANQVVDAALLDGYFQSVAPGYFGGGDAVRGGGNGAVMAGQGAYLGFNHTGSDGETDFISHPGKGSNPGFDWFVADSSGNLASSPSLPLMRLRPSGLSVKGLLRTDVYTVANLPSCSSALEGSRAAVTDAAAPTFLGALTGGGKVHSPAYCNGTSWVAN